MEHRDPFATPTRRAPARGRRELHRDHPERRLAGVCAALAAALDVPLVAVRAAFLIGAVLPPTSAVVLALYLALWFLLPPSPTAPSGLDRAVGAGRALAGDLGLVDEETDTRDERSRSARP
jgi:phage shock protein PspC (stress-responsive transcriptional regulator)